MTNPTYPDINGIIMNGAVHIFVQGDETDCSKCSLQKQCDVWDDSRSMCDLFGFTFFGHYEKKGEICRLPPPTFKYN